MLVRKVYLILLTWLTPPGLPCEGETLFLIICEIVHFYSTVEVCDATMLIRRYSLVHNCFNDAVRNIPLSDPTIKQGRTKALR